jgi:hypothetical protein
MASRWIGVATGRTHSPRSVGAAADKGEIGKGGLRRCTWEGLDALSKELRSAGPESTRSPVAGGVSEAKETETWSFGSEEYCERIYKRSTFM